MRPHNLGAFYEADAGCSSGLRLRLRLHLRRRRRLCVCVCVCVRACVRAMARSCLAGRDVLVHRVDLVLQRIVLGACLLVHVQLVLPVRQALRTSEPPIQPNMRHSLKCGIVLLSAPCIAMHRLQPSTSRIAHPEHRVAQLPAGGVHALRRVAASDRDLAQLEHVADDLPVVQVWLGSLDHSLRVPARR